MPRVSFTRDFDYRPTSGVVLANKAGQKNVLITTAHAKAAVEAGAATYDEGSEPRQAREAAGENSRSSSGGDTRRTKAGRRGGDGDAKAPRAPKERRPAE